MSAEPTDLPAVVGPLRGVRVLVADDSPANLKVARLVLECEGAHVVLVANGQQALDRLREMPGSVDVVLMDVQMPVLGGYETIRRIRGELGLVHLPIVALTAATVSSERHAAQEAGAQDLLGTPIDSGSLLRCIRRHLALGGEAAPALPAKAGPAWPEIEGIDSRDVYNRLNGDLGLFRSLLASMLVEPPDLECSETADAFLFDTLAARAHRIRGTAGTLGAREVERVAATAEAFCRGRLTELAVDATRRLHQALVRLAHAAAPELARAELEASTPAATPLPPLGRDDLAQLERLLRDSDLDALGLFDALSAQLQSRLGSEAHGRLQSDVHGLRFDDAVTELARGRDR